MPHQLRYVFRPRKSGTERLKAVGNRNTEIGIPHISGQESSQRNSLLRFNAAAGTIFFLMIPSTYVFLTLYSLINLNVINWGTREAVAKATGKVRAQAYSRSVWRHGLWFVQAFVITALLYKGRDVVDTRALASSRR